MEKIRVGIVNYLNTLPLLRGIEQDPVREQIRLSGEYPSRLAQALLEDQLDMGLVPVAILPSLPGAALVGDYGIACDGAVASVCLFSDCPLDQITTILLDYQSRSSVALLRILVEKLWKLNVQIVETHEECSGLIAGTTAGLIIGDRCLRYRKKARYVFDLGTAWKDFTGLPFVFAAWVSNKPLPASFIEAFNRANEAGVQQAASIAAGIDFPDYPLEEYFTRNIQYRFTPEMRKGMALFLQYLAEKPA